MENKKILFAASECLGYAKTGGLADVVASLSTGLAKKGYDVKVVMPLYKIIKDKIFNDLKLVAEYETLYNYIGVYSKVERGVEYLFIDNEMMFGRDNLYSYDDDTYRFGVFDRAVLDMLGHIDFYPDIIHCHDWQAGLIPYILKTEHAADENYKNTKTILTIHNIMYQGWAPISMANVLHLQLSNDYVMSNCVNMLKGGIQSATKINTVSPTYRNETFTPTFSYGLDDILKSREASYCGILNGIDCEYYSPKNDQLLVETYTASTAYKMKNINKQWLFEELDMIVDSEKPLFAIVSRLTDQKGFGLINYVLPQILQNGNSVVIIGTGDAHYEDFLRYLDSTFPNFSFCNKYNEELAHQVYAAADFYLMPSGFEPCGLSQMIAMSYGAIPIVYATGGLKDSVKHFNITTKKGCGIVFENFDVNGLTWAVNQAEEIYKKKSIFKVIMKNAMLEDNSIEHATKNYIDFYNDL